MKRQLILFAMCFLSLNAMAQEKMKTLDSALLILEEQELFHGQVLISEAGEIQFLKSYGQTSEGDRYSADTPINIQSVAKGITALSVLILHERGQLNINDLLAEHLPELDFYQGVRIKHLLNHTSGLPRFFELVFSEWPQDKFLTIDGMLELIQEHQPSAAAAPGTYESYNQTAYMLLAEVVERVSKQEFTVFVEDNIFKPAKMNSTFFNVSQTNYQESLGESDIDKMFLLMVGDGGIQSTAEDLYRFNEAIASGQLITPIVMNMSYRPAKLSSGEEGRYGYGGSLIEKEIGKRAFQHLGQGTVSNAVFTRYIDENHTLIVLHDQSVQYASDVYILINNIWQGEKFELPQKRVVYQLSDEQINKYVGDYGDNGFMHLTAQDGKLFIQPDGNPSPVEIIPSSATTFYFEDQDMEWEIYLNDAGEVIGFGPLGQRDFMMKRWKK